MAFIFNTKTTFSSKGDFENATNCKLPGMERGYIIVEL